MMYYLQRQSLSTFTLVDLTIGTISSYTNYWREQVPGTDLFDYPYLIGADRQNRRTSPGGRELSLCCVAVDRRDYLRSDAYRNLARGGARIDALWGKALDLVKEGRQIDHEVTRQGLRFLHHYIHWNKKNAANDFGTGLTSDGDLGGVDKTFHFFDSAYYDRPAYGYLKESWDHITHCIPKSWDPITRHIPGITRHPEGGDMNDLIANDIGHDFKKLLRTNPFEKPSQVIGTHRPFRH